MTPAEQIADLQRQVAEATGEAVEWRNKAHDVTIRFSSECEERDRLRAEVEALTEAKRQAEEKSIRANWDLDTEHASLVEALDRGHRAEAELEAAKRLLRRALPYLGTDPIFYDASRFLEPAAKGAK